MKHVETTNPRASVLVTYRGSRPCKTEADLIAAALPKGYVTCQPLYTLKGDADECGGDTCFKCHMGGDGTSEYFDTLRQAWDNEMNGYGVTWDPTIRL